MLPQIRHPSKSQGVGAKKKPIQIPERCRTTFGRKPFPTWV